MISRYAGESYPNRRSKESHTAHEEATEADSDGYNVNFWIEAARKDLDEVLTMIDVLTINDAEARELSGEFSLVKAAKKILAMGPKYLIIKKGEHGALLFNENHVFFAPALPLEDVFDPTGAGDTFAGGFIGHVAQTQDISFDNMKRSIIFGSAMASFCVEKFGTERLMDFKRRRKLMSAYKSLSTLFSLIFH